MFPGESRLRQLIALALLLATPPSAHGETLEHFGTVHFPISCSAGAQQQFDRAVALLHSFSYPETVKGFEAVAKAEPGCAMAYWGIAISQRPNPLMPPFDQEALARGWQAIERARSAGATTPREHDWIEALAVFFADYPAIDQRMRTLRYEAAMAQLHARYPDDAEAAIFYALALNEAADPGDKSYARQIQAATLLEALQRQLPHHPGIPHYLIHSYDFPPLAEKGLPAARRYADLAPPVPHALHMPSHIFAMLGMWPEVIGAERAADREIQRQVLRASGAQGEDPAGDPARYHHLDFLINAYLQTAQDDNAKGILDQRNLVLVFPESFPDSGHIAFSAIPARYAIERGAWREAAYLKIPTTPYPQAEAVSRFARALGEARIGEIEPAQRDLARLGELEAALVQAKEDFWAEQVGIYRQTGEAWLALAEGHRDEAIATMRQAADRSDRNENHSAFENPLLPMRELLGDLLLEAHENAAALTAFEASLKTAPNRYRSFAGAAKAARRLGDKATAIGYYGKLIALCGKTNRTRPDLMEARRFLAMR